MIHGNHSNPRKWNRHPVGIGAIFERVGDMSWICATGKSGDADVLLRADSIYSQVVSNLPLSLQAIGGDVEISFTLQNPGYAANRSPNVQANISWVNKTTVTQGDIVQSPLSNFVMMRVRFMSATATEFYLCGR